MKAMTVPEFGEPSVLTLADQPDPTPSRGELLVEVHAAGLNPVDTKLRSGKFRGPVEPGFVPGYDVSGVVRALGEGCKRFKVGDAVYASPPLGRDGSHAELVIVNERVAAHKPHSLDHVQAAAVPLALITAWEVAYDMADVRPGQTVLIHAAAGGVGHLALQLAKARRCTVFATASRDESKQLCRDLGADEVIDYEQEDVGEVVSRLTAGMGCEAVFDFVGAEVFKASVPLVRLRGSLSTIVGIPKDADLTPLFMKAASLHAEFMGATALNGHVPDHQGHLLREAAAMIDAGTITPHVTATYPLADLAKAHADQATQHTAGKRVITVAA